MTWPPSVDALARELVRVAHLVSAQGLARFFALNAQTVAARAGAIADDAMTASTMPDVSGIGRDGPYASLEFFTELKATIIPIDPAPLPRYGA